MTSHCCDRPLMTKEQQVAVFALLQLRFTGQDKFGGMPKPDKHDAEGKQPATHPLFTLIGENK